MRELTDLTIAETGQGLRRRSFSAVELTQAHLDRIATLDPALNAFIHVAADEALASARAADRALSRGEDGRALLGIPYAVKDNIDVAGIATTCHSRLAPREPAAADAAVVSRLAAAGAVCLGKNALHEFATGGPAFDLPFPPARNPWNPDLHPGGSSSGGGAAVAAGLAMAAIGTDTAGSVRNPATCCGVVGLKPTYDLVARRGVFPLSFSLDHVGPIARSVEDCALILDAIVEEPPERSHAAEIGGLPSGLRVGVLDAFHRDARIDDAVGAGFDRALGLLSGLGARLVTVSPPPLAAFQACGRVLQQAESYAIHRRWLGQRPGEYSEIGRRKLAAGAFLSAAEYIEAQQARRSLIRAYRDATRDVDVVLAVSSFTLPCRLDDPVAVAATYERHARMPFNVTGDPALALAVAIAPEGLPIGVQLAAAPFGERVLLRVAHALERAVGLSPLRPSAIAAGVRGRRA